MKKSIGPRTLVYPTPVFIVGTYDRAGQANVMTAAWGGNMLFKTAVCGRVFAKSQVFI